MFDRRNQARVKVTHTPTGIVATVDSNRHQHKNREQAIELLRARIYAEGHVERKSTLVRTYNLGDNTRHIDDFLDIVGGY
jgi:peptide chain release factor 1